MYLQKTGRIYISIKDIAPFVGYEAHTGEYKVDIQDKNKMYVEALEGTETTSFYLNSSTISKVAPNTTNDYENIKIKEPVVMSNDKMYIISDGFVTAFNTLFSYDKAENRVTMQTLPYLIKGYSGVIEDYGYTSLSEDFNNQKALIYGMIVASKNNKSNFGVVSVEGEEILSPRYNNIQFIEASGEFIITNSSEKVGIAYNTGKTKITVAYDDIKVMDSALGLYLVKSNEKYGVVNSTENTIIHTEYDQIGINVADFPSDNIKNQYILYDKMIPAQINGKWRLFDIEGKRITGDEYDSVGYKVVGDKNTIAKSAVTIGETETIIVGKDKLYGGVDVKGNELIPIRYEAIYSITNAGKTTYYILYNYTEYNAVEVIDAMKERLGYKDEVQEELNPNPNPEPDTTNDNNVTTNELNRIDITNVTELNTNSVEGNNEVNQVNAVPAE